MLKGMLIAILIAVIGATGWFVYDQNKKEPAPTVTTASQQQTKNDPSEGGKYLVIKEWKVRFELIGDLKGDISYFVDDKANKDLGGPIKIDLVSKKFSAGNLKCAVEERSEPRVLVGMFKEMDDEGTETLDPPAFKRIGNTRYYFVTTSCQEAINKGGSADDKALAANLETTIRTTLSNY